MSSQVKVTAILTARPEKGEKLRALLVGMAAACRAEPGNLRWDVWQDQSRPGCFVLDELYLDGAAVTAHRETPHYRNYVAQIGDLAERIAVVLSPMDVRA